jgi:hypothetical protein
MVALCDLRENSKTFYGLEIWKMILCYSQQGKDYDDDSSSSSSSSSFDVDDSDDEADDGGKLS